MRFEPKNLPNEAMGLAKLAH